MISIQDRKDFTHKALAWFEQEKEKQNIDNDLDFAILVYNSALRDFSDALDVYIEKNPRHINALTALKREVEGWMPLI